MSGETIRFEKAADQADDGKREHSTITFPYSDLEAAVEVARAVYNRGGHGGCSVDELAAEMKQTISGAFRLKTGTAKIFDLIEKDGKSGFKLTELGRQIVSPDSDRVARAEAFMRVPLYAAVFEKYRGHLLPPPRALEREMQSLGVSSKQTDKARQAFERSARQAGYFDSGDDRLVRPRCEGQVRQNEQKPDDAAGDDQGSAPPSNGSGGGGKGQTPPPPPPPKALEYQLIDLMSEPDIDDTVKQSIWSLVQYLTARKSRKAEPSPE